MFFADIFYVNYLGLGWKLWSLYQKSYLKITFTFFRRFFVQCILSMYPHFAWPAWLFNKSRCIWLRKLQGLLFSQFFIIAKLGRFLCWGKKYMMKRFWPATLLFSFIKNAIVHLDIKKYLVFLAFLNLHNVPLVDIGLILINKNRTTLC